MSDNEIVRVIPHEGVDAECGSIEVRVSVFIHWDDNKGRRLRPDALTQEQAKEAAIELARKEREKLK